MVTDRDALNELRSVFDLSAPHVVQHYLYFPEEHASQSVADLLTKRGFDVENRLGADNVNWLVLAKHRIIVTEEVIETLRANFEAVAAHYNGEYDGWEASAN